ncbi:MAG: hypothetical protein J7M05_04390 [Anaerolineae bacterium]|nr:hypothetical protein [Anaerolineae bacterium]
MHILPPYLWERCSPYPLIFAPIKLGYSDGSGQVNDCHLTFYTLRSRYLGASQ